MHQMELIKIKRSMKKRLAMDISLNARMFEEARFDDRNAACTAHYRDFRDAYFEYLESLDFEEQTDESDAEKQADKSDSEKQAKKSDSEKQTNESDAEASEGPDDVHEDSSATAGQAQDDGSDYFDNEYVTIFDDDTSEAAAQGSNAPAEQVDTPASRY